MIYSDEFLDEFRREPIKKTIEVDSIVSKYLEGSGGWTEDDLNVLTESYALLVEAIEADVFPFKTNYPKLTGELESDCLIARKFIQDIVGKCKIEATRLKLEFLRSKFKTSIGSSFSYEFSQGDLERVQGLINTLRSEISGLAGLESDHRRRLLNRLEKLQSELHKKMSDLDKFWGLVGDAGVVFGKLGTDAKPVVDRIKEIADIIWQTQSRAEELPSGTQLPSLDNKTNQPSNGTV